MTVHRPNRPIYLDYQATTPCDPRVVDRMLPYFSDIFGNPHSADHRHGWEAEAAVETARGQVATLIGAKPRDIIFTSGATESNNLAIKGAARHRRQAEGRDTVITLASEHKCVLESTARLGREGFDVKILPIQKNGLLDLSTLKAALDDRVSIVSVMAANNEIGVIQSLADIGAMVRECGAWFHTDAAQAFGKYPLDVEALCIDMMSISGHKIYGPKGVGALYVRGRKPKVELDPLMDGGGQERGLRSGTLPVPLCVGLGAAADIAKSEMGQEAERLTRMRNRLCNLNITVPGVESSELLAALDGLSVSSGSACSSGAQAASHVLQALGHDPAKVAAGLRIGLGRFTTDDDITAAAEMLLAAVSTK